MESQSRPLSLAPPTPPHTLSHSGSLRRHRSSSNSTNSPEFEFWRLGPNNPLSFPQPDLHSADELFSDGVLLPLHLLHLHHDHQQPPSNPDPDPDPKPDPNPEAETQPELEPGPVPDEPEQSISASITSSAGNTILTASKRWKEIFKRGEKKTTGNSDETTMKSEKSRKKREKKNAGNNGNGNSTNNNGGNSNPAELNINIWPFSRSRSAGNNSGRPRPAASSGRKVSSAPCSRSNSSGDSKSRRHWPSSPGRTGVHLSRTSPVWQVKRNRAVSDETRRGKPANNAAKGRVLNLNVPMCMGYRQQLSCRSEESGGVGGGGGAARGGGSGSNGNLFALRGLFSKKSVLTV